ncbi:MAG TPA: MlaA family lipoprotein, partial [Burkholderiales bacterium]|nr:MlaA family lipoprotein [Burkholderiales bacterium]
MLLALASGCASLPPGEGGGDPLEPVNRPIFRFNDALDKAVLKPVAEGYVKVTPKPVRTAVSNFFDNVGYLNVALNDFLQGKGRQGFADLGRFLVNSTVGVLGLFDIA